MITFNPNKGLAEYVYSAQTTLPFSFKIYEETNILLAYTETVTGIPTTTEIHQDDYIVTITGDQGGSIDLTKLPKPIPNGATVLIKRNLPTDRTTQYQENGDLRADVLNEDQNYQTYLIQDVHLDKKYNLQVPRIPGFNGQLPLPQPGYYLQWNPSGTGVYNSIGTPGVRGPEGPRGLQGNPGTNGVDGGVGPQGIQGTVGPRGPQGPQGNQGIQGAGINLMGHDTEANIIAKQGNSGEMWIINTGAKKGHGLVSDGTTGPTQWVDVGTVQGQDGAKGIQGPKGSDGAQGPKGQSGSTGPKGDVGPQGPTPPVEMLAPIGSIIAYAGTKASLPQGWVIADGSNGTINMTDKFVLGSNGNVGTVGGYADSIVVSHNHTISHTHKMNNHTHSINHNHGAVNTNSAGNHSHSTSGWTHTSGHGYGHVPGSNTHHFKTSTYSMGTAGKHHHSVNLPNYSGTSGSNDGSTRASSASHSGTSGVSGGGRNLPPFVKLYYIQRIA